MNGQRSWVIGLILHITAVSAAVVQAPQPWYWFSSLPEPTTNTFTKQWKNSAVSPQPLASDDCQAFHVTHLILLGHNALEKALACRDKRQDRAHWVVAYVPEALWYQMASQHFHTLSELSIDIIAVDPPPLCQLALARTIYPRGRRIGTFSSQYTKRWQSMLSRFTDNDIEAFRLDIAPVTQTNFAGTFLFSIKRHDLVLLPLAPQFINAYTARNVLLAAYRQRTPLIGNSRNFVHAGALASCIVTIEQQGTLLKDILSSPAKGFQKGVRLHFSEAFDIVVNPQVAQAYGVLPGTPKRLKAQIEKQLDRWQKYERDQAK